MYAGKFAPGSEYKTAFRLAVDALIETKMPVPWRNKVITDLTDAYIKQTGETPDSPQLGKLANYILQDDLLDKSPDKVTQTAYPFLSYCQLRLRHRRERVWGELLHFTKGTKPSRRKTIKEAHQR